MSITNLAYQEGHQLGNKLSQHIIKRNEKDFERAAGRRAAISSKEELKVYADKMRAGFEQAMGGIPYDASFDLQSEVTGIIKEKFFHIEKVIFQSRASVYVTANLYIPHNCKKPCGAVLFCPGHEDTGKEAKDYQILARSLASAGLVAMIMDPFGQGERYPYIEPGVKGKMIAGCSNVHEYAGRQIMLGGDAPVRYFIADAKRAIDYLISRPEVNPEAIGVMGSSGGGTMTCNMMVCDTRIKAAAPCAFLSSRRAILHSGKVQDAEQIWMGTKNFTFDHADVLACFAPKPCRILNNDSDFFPREGTLQTIEDAKKLYGLYEAEDRLDMSVDHSTHGLNQNLTVAATVFFTKVLNGEAKEGIPEAMVPIDGRQLRCTQTGQVRTSYPDAKFLFEEQYEKLMRECMKIGEAEACVKEAAAAFLREKTYAFRSPVSLQLREFPTKQSGGVVSNSYFWFNQDNMPNYGILMRSYKDIGKDIPVKVCLFDGGTKHIDTNKALIQHILRSGYAVFILDVTGIGLCSPDPHMGVDIHANGGALTFWAKHLFFLGDSLAAIRLYDLECLPKVLEAIPNVTDFSLYATGNSGILASLYGLMHEEVSVEVENCQSISDVVLHRYYEEYDLTGYILPGIAPYTVNMVQCEQR